MNNVAPLWNTLATAEGLPSLLCLLSTLLYYIVILGMVVYTLPKVCINFLSSSDSAAFCCENRRNKDKDFNNSKSDPSVCVRKQAKSVGTYLALS